MRRSIWYLFTRNHIVIGGQKIASVTTGQSLAAYNEDSREHTHLVMASLYAADSLTGFFKKLYHHGAIWGAKPEGQASVIGALGLLMLWLSYYARRSLLKMARPATLASLGVLILMHCHGDDIVRPPTSQQLQAILQGDTSLGLPLGTFYYHHNHLGSSALVTDTAGAVVTRIEYQPYGEIDQQHSTGGDQVTHKFTGQEFDVEANLYNYGARFYDQTIGLFISADSIVPSAADSQSYNRYMYVRGNAIQYTDPTGHCIAQQCWGAPTPEEGASAQQTQARPTRRPYPRHHLVGSPLEATAQQTQPGPTRRPHRPHYQNQWRQL